MPFHLTIRAGEASPASRISDYIATYDPIITEDEEGRISVGVIHFDTLLAKPLHLDSLAALSDKIAELLNDKPDYAVCIHFEQTTGTPLLVVVKNEETERLSTILDSGLFQADIGYA